jgi:gliding motility-associated-like protein
MPKHFFKKYLSLIIVVLLQVYAAKAQPGKEAWHWQFGDKAALDFSTGTPVAGTCAINTGEGSASVSDPNTGLLLFYTDGTTAWDKNNNQMPNGFGMIGGQGTSTQAALIVPKPGSSSIYYLLSADQGGYVVGSPNQGVHYSIVDMSLNGGLGDVSTKNVLLTPPPTTEKLTAVRHCNGRDYWIIDHPFNSNAFNAYLLTASGINTTAVVSNVGTVQNGNSLNTIGYLKASSNAKKIACIVSYMNFLEIFDFNNSTGQVNNPIKINFPNNLEAYGIAFSPDNSKIYTTFDISGNLFQYDISSNNATSIIASQTNIQDSISSDILGTLQLASDGKIYISIQDSIRLAVINSPNNLGVSCNYQLHGPILPAGAICGYGLPNFIEANGQVPYHSTVSNTSLCTVSSYSLYATKGSNYQWYNGNTTQTNIVNSFGTYWVSFTDSIGCVETDTFHITTAQAPVIAILHDSLECGNTFIPVTVDATYSNTASYLWNDGFTNPVHILNAPGKYEVNYTFSNDCVSKDSFNLLLIPYPVINLGDDTAFCNGTKYIDASNPSSSYLWNNGVTTAGITITQPGTYWVQVNHNGCINSDTLVVSPNLKQLNFIMPNIVTPNNDGINDMIDFNTYQFSSLQIEIYNRWGIKVFESSDPACSWKPSEDDGTYFYTLQYKIDCGTESQSKMLKGYITLIR